MRKIFTLIAASLLTMGAFAQTSSVIKLDPTATYKADQVITSGDVSVTLGTDSKYTLKTTGTKDTWTELTPFIQSVTITASDGTTSTSDGFAYIAGANNPKSSKTLKSGSGFDGSADKQGSLPQNGCYYIVKATQAGDVAFAMQLNTDKELYVVDASAATEGDGVLTVDNNTAVLNSKVVCKDETGATITTTTGGKNGIVFDTKHNATANFSVEANKPYYVFCTGSKLGFIGVKFSPSASTAIKTIATAEKAADNAVYNLAGQRVNKSFKGIVISNGKKLIR